MTREKLRAGRTKKLPQNNPAAERLKLLDHKHGVLNQSCRKSFKSALDVGAGGGSLGHFLGLNTEVKALPGQMHDTGRGRNIHYLKITQYNSKITNGPLLPEYCYQVQDKYL